MTVFLVGIGQSTPVKSGGRTRPKMGPPILHHFSPEVQKSAIFRVSRAPLVGVCRVQLQKKSGQCPQGLPREGTDY